MSLRINTAFRYALLLISAVFFLSACGQTGALYMPETYSKKPKTAVKKQQTIEEATTSENITTEEHGKEN